MLLPINDDNPLEGITHAYVTWGLIAANVLVFVALQQGWRPEIDIATAFGYGAIPAVVNHAAVLPAEYTKLPPELTLVSYMFLHGGWLHLIGNMAFLWVFGDNVEDALGHFRYLVFYLLCAAAGALAHGLLDPASEAPLIGASGAISGIVAAYFLLHPKVRVWVLVFFRIPLPLPAVIPLAFWIGQQFFMLVVDPGSGVSWSAHVGGIIAGLVLVVILRRRDVPLFDRTIVTPRAVRHKAEPVTASQPPSPDATRPPVPWGRQTGS